MKKLIKAVRKEIKDGRIYLYDKNGDYVKGEDACWDGDFYCNNNELTTLEGSPKEVGGGFYCYHNKLTTLEGSPKEVGGDFYCTNNQLTTLEGGPKEVGGDFYCYNNELTTLEGSPKEVGGGFSCDNNKLTTLEGGPKEVGGDFYCANNQLTTLEGGPKEVGGGFHCDNNQLTTLKAKPKKGTFVSYLKRGYLFADNILSKIIKVTKKDNYDIFYIKSIGGNKKSFCVKRGELFSHGETIKEAMEDLVYKISDRNTDEYRNWTLTSWQKRDDMIQAYRKITGACSFGVKSFLKNNEIGPKITPEMVINITKGHYGNDDFVKFFEE